MTWNGMRKMRGNIIDDRLVELISRTAYAVGKRFGVDVWDVRGRLLNYVAEMEIDYAGVVDERPLEVDYEQALKSLRKDLSVVAEKEARKLRAKDRGYSVDDEAFYSIGHLKELLEVYYQTGVTEHPPVGFSESVRHEKNDGSTTGNFLAGMMDVEIGLGKIKPRYQDILRLRYGVLAEWTDEGICRLAQSEVRDITGWHWEALRALLGDSGEEVGRRVRQALTALQRALGGSSPWRRDERLDVLLATEGW